MINNTTLVGRLTKDPELRKTQNGTSVVSFTIAIQRMIQKEGSPEADFINCIAFNKIADNLAKYMKKGSMIGVVGRLQSRSYDDKDGKRIYITEVVADTIEFLSFNTDKQNTEE